MAFEIEFGILAVIGIVLASEVVIGRAIDLSKRFGISDFFIGLTVVSIGTSFPEISSHVFGSLHILADSSLRLDISNIIFGTNIGSNLIQITLVIGVVGLLTVLRAHRRFFEKDYLLMLGAILLLYLLASDGVVSQVEGIFLAGLYVVYMFSLLRKERAERDLRKANGNVYEKLSKKVVVDVGMILGGLVLLMVSADQAITSSVFVVKTFGLDGSVIGAFVIGVASVMPEFISAVRAAMKDSQGMSLGTLVGSNITNPLLAIGLGASITNYTVSANILNFDLPFWFVASLAPLALFWRKGALSRRGAMVLIFIYVLYIVWKLEFLQG
ncbi:MAG: sodium:calcium antiporter [Candidatus Micrarchaeia archaeon]